MWIVLIVVWLVKCLLWVGLIFVAGWICEIMYLALGFRGINGESYVYSSWACNDLHALNGGYPL
jgi:hypothetical protein